MRSNTGSYNRSFAIIIERQGGEQDTYEGEGKKDLKGGAVAQAVERATPGEEVPGSIPAVAARSLLVGSVSV